MLDADKVPFLPSSTVSGVVAQGMYDLLRFSYFSHHRNKLCEYQIHGRVDGGQPGRPNLPCAIFREKADDYCLMCRFFGSPAKEGGLEWKDLKCITDRELIKAIMNSNTGTPEERRQVVKEAASHRRNMRTKTVKEKHFYVQEEGAPLTFAGDIPTSEPISELEASYLAAAFKNTRAIGRRKSRGKGECAIKATFVDKSGNTRKRDIDLVSSLLS